MPTGGELVRLLGWVCLAACGLNFLLAIFVDEGAVAVVSLLAAAAAGSVGAYVLTREGRSP